MWLFEQTNCRGDIDTEWKEIPGETIREALEALIRSRYEEEVEEMTGEEEEEEDRHTSYYPKLSDFGYILEEGEEDNIGNGNAWVIRTFNVEGETIVFGFGGGEETTSIVAKTKREVIMVVGTMMVKGEENFFIPGY